MPANLPVHQPVVETVVEQTISEVLVSRSLEQSTRRMTELALTIIERAKRLEEAGFPQLAAAVRTTTESTMIGFLNVLVGSQPEDPTMVAPPPRLGRKPKTTE